VAVCRVEYPVRVAGGRPVDAARERGPRTGRSDRVTHGGRLHAGAAPALRRFRRGPGRGRGRQTALRRRVRDADWPGRLRERVRLRSGYPDRQQGPQPIPAAIGPAHLVAYRLRPPTTTSLQWGRRDWRDVPFSVSETHPAPSRRTGSGNPLNVRPGVIIFQGVCVNERKETAARAREKPPGCRREVPLEFSHVTHRWPGAMEPVDARQELRTGEPP